MIPIPSPLHPALVHFPIVLILLGTLVVLASVLIRRWHLPWIAAGLLVLGSAGAIAAAWTGGEEEESVGELNSNADQILDEHEKWGERTRNISIVAALLALAAASASRFPVASRAVSIAAACAALASSYCVANAGHYGGQLVYKNGVGINTAAGDSTTNTALIPSGERKGGKDDDDD
jgi:uncharacterized membrane protein